MQAEMDPAPPTSDRVSWKRFIFVGRWVLSSRCLTRVGGETRRRLIWIPLHSAWGRFAGNRDKALFCLMQGHLYIKTSDCGTKDAFKGNY